MANNPTSQVTPEPQQDIEVYVWKQTPEAIFEWLGTTFDAASTPVTQGRSHSLSAKHNGHTIPITLVENASGKAWTSLWFDSEHTGWLFDVDCARALHRETGWKLRCNATFWSGDNGNMDEWLEIDEDGVEKLINWPS